MYISSLAKKCINEIQGMSKHFKVVPVRQGFARIYWKSAYIHEIPLSMFRYGYDIKELDQRVESQEYYEEYEDGNNMVMYIKNYREGYYDTMLTIRKRFWLLKHSQEHYERTLNAYKKMVIK